LVTTPSAVFVVGISKSLSSHTLHVTTLSVSTGELLASVDVLTSIAEGPSGVLTLSSDTTTLDPRVVWLEAGTICSLALVPNLTEKPTSVKGSAYSKIIDIGLPGKGHFVALKTDDSGRVLKLDAEKAGLKVIWEFADSVSTYSVSRLLRCPYDDLRQNQIGLQNHFILVESTGMACLISDACFGRSCWA
jgi:ER membrane protein complex subunit 1